MRKLTELQENMLREIQTYINNGKTESDIVEYIKSNFNITEKNMEFIELCIKDLLSLKPKTSVEYAKMFNLSHGRILELMKRTLRIISMIPKESHRAFISSRFLVRG